MNLTERDKQLIREHIERGEPLPPKYKLLLFADAPEVELIWQGKSSEVTNVVLPFQSIEQIDEPRQQIGQQIDSLFSADSRGRQASGWTNKLIWGDNKLVLSSLKNGPLRREIEDAGGLKLIYIDPPFDVGADFSFNVDIGENETVTKEPNVIEEMAYRDTWGEHGERYSQFLFERLRLMRELLSDEGSLCIHCDWRVSPLVRLLADEVFGRDSLVNEIIWVHQIMGGAHGSRLPKAHESIIWVAKSERFRLNSEDQYVRVPFSDYVLNSMKQDEEGRWYYTRRRMSRKATAEEKQGKAHTITYVEDPSRGTLASDVWSDMLSYQAKPEVITKYPTQKPDELIERIIGGGSRDHEIVADFFCGSGTTLAVAERLGRKWIGCDLGRFAIHTTRKRLIGVQRELKAAAKPYRSFEILNLGKYERQYFVGIDPTLPEEQRRAQTIQREEHYLTLILSAYKAERVFQMPPFHGRKGPAAVVVGPIDAPVTFAQVNEVIAECRRKRISKADVLGFEFEMGLCPAVQDDAKTKGVSLSLKYIPKDVFDKRAVEKGQVKFYDVAYAEVLPKVKGTSATVSLKDFGVFYQQDELDSLGEKLKPGGSKVTVEAGQVVK
ncbi:MAG: DNA methyltransferase, partial [Candidatus Binataceae bacterium]